MILNARKEAGIVNPDSGRFLEFDIYFPSLKLAFEYQVIHLSLSLSLSPLSIVLTVTASCRKDTITLRTLPMPMFLWNQFRKEMN